MGLFNKVKQAITPKDVNLQIAEARQKLNELEARFTVLIRKERNVVGNVTSKAAKVAAVERLRNAYASLRLVHIAQERLYDVSSTNELNGAVKDLNKAMGLLNKLDRKSEAVAPLFLNFRTRKMLNRREMAEEGGMKQYYDGALEELLVGEGVMNKLVNTKIPLQALLKEDEETQENLDEFMEFIQSADTELGGMNDLDDLDDLINNLD